MVIKDHKDQTTDIKNAKYEMVTFLSFLIDIQLDQLISNTINLFQEKLEEAISSGKYTYDELYKNR